jgi:cell shape-determining protein MreD
MRWFVFIIFAFAALVLDIGLRPLLRIDVAAGASPSFVLILMVFVAMWAPPRVALWSGLVLGLLVDLSSLSPTLADLSVGRGYALMGPAALGFMLGSYAVVQFRGLAYRDSPLALAALVFVGGLFAHLVWVALLTVRGLPMFGYPLPGWSAASELYSRFWVLVYSALVAAPVGYVLLKTHAAWGFDSQKSRR